MLGALKKALKNHRRASTGAQGEGFGAVDTVV